MRATFLYRRDSSNARCEMDATTIIGLAAAIRGSDVVVIIADSPSMAVLTGICTSICRTTRRPEGTRRNSGLV
jgi:hypothetical protein